MGLLTAPLSLAREPLRLTFRVWEFGLSTAAEAVRIGMELLDPNRGAPPPDLAHGPAPDHVDEPVLVAEAAEEGAADGPGPELHVDPPWDGYDDMTAAAIRDRLARANATEAAAVELYEATRKHRRSVLDAAERALRT